ncbi:Cache, type 2 domain protein [Methanocorpusculum labreanum Z]|uniref:Cache, type 2 domain protein n=1 Tax=Methanocorpusculum labreanum (strain ATCC 43576 / DSM 4855 / Z) TaxID=410358 RepID=A2SRB8_METLZ|nr:cache domain-containing protein [Methanocorpusculum labreanum]ABN06874.1 Cache, type 2 domain protein [Methanocorpusculum labreanum Z]
MLRHAFSKILFILVVLLFISASGCIQEKQETPELQPVSDEYYAKMDTVLYPYMQTVDEQMQEITALVWETARELDGVPMDDPAVDLALLKLKSEIPLSFDSGRLDKDNVLRAVTNEQYIEWSVGTYIGENQYTEEELKAAGENCTISPFTLFDNGEQGVMVIAPVYDANGNFDGTLQVALDVGYLFSGPAEELRTKYGYTVWAVQDDGIVIYDEDTQEIGVNLTKPTSAYTPSLNSAIADILANESGQTSYIFYTLDWHDINQTNAVWSTLDPGYGQNWRVVLIDNVPMPRMTSELTVTQDELKAFVTNAYVYARTHEKTEALAAFNDPKGEFIDGELYIFAETLNGTMLSLPYQPALIGTDQWMAEDTTGVKYIQRQIARAEQGGGYVMYLYPNPTQDFATELKLAYVMPIDNEWFIGAGIYEHNTLLAHSTSVDWQKRNELIKQVRTMQYLAEVEGVSAVTDMMMDPNSDIQVEGLYPMAITENGTVLAFARNPDIVGTNQLGRVNSLDISLIREGISLGKEGGGLMYTLLWDSTLNKEIFILVYVVPADDDAYFASFMILE